MKSLHSLAAAFIAAMVSACSSPAPQPDLAPAPQPDAAVPGAPQKEKADAATHMVYMFYNPAKATKKPEINMHDGEKLIFDNIFVFCNWHTGKLIKATSFNVDDSTPPEGSFNVGAIPSPYKIYIKYGDGIASSQDLKDQMQKVPQADAALAHENLSACLAHFKKGRFNNLSPQ